MSYGIGIDIGIASVGHAVVFLNDMGEPIGISRMGVRIFDSAENPKDGSSLAAPRREARSMRRRIRRHQHRLERIRNLIVSQGILSSEQLSQLYSGNITDVYALRVRALDELISDSDLCRILIHLAQRRGFRSNRKSDASDKEAGKLLGAVSDNEKRMKDNGYRTVGEMFYKDPVFAEHKRNKEDSYLSTVARDAIEAEAKLIFTKQREFGNTAFNKEFETRYLDILLGQRSFDEGPGKGSQYSGFIDSIGNCTFEKEEQRAPKASYSFEMFQLLQKINTIRIIKEVGARSLTDEERICLIKLAHKMENPTYSRVRKELGLSDDETFNSVYYRTDGKDAESKQKLGCLKAYHEMRKALDKVKKGRIEELDIAVRNNIAAAMTLYKTDANVIMYINKHAPQLTENDIQQILTMKGFSKFGHLSIKACNNIIPGLEAGLQYNEACEAAGYHFQAHSGSTKSMLLPPIRPDSAENNQITSPVVRRAISQTIKVINAIIREQGESPTFINIELARDMSKDKMERDKAEKEMQQNAERNQRIYDYLKNELHVADPSGQDIVKYRLFEEQNGICLYSLKSFDITRLFEPGYAEVDHIIPYSISFDDRFNNKVLVFAEENRKKGNNLPLQYLQGKAREDYQVYVEANVRNYRKKQALLKACITEEDKQKFKERNLQDTRTVSRFMYNYIRDNLAFAESPTGKINCVVAVNGAVTAYLRKRWGLSKVRADGDLHHATDALVVACTTPGLIRRVSRYANYDESRYVQTDDGSYLINPETGEVMQHFPQPWDDFRKEWEARTSSAPCDTLRAMRLPNYAGAPIDSVKPIFVSHMPKHKVTGAAHKETIRSAKLADEGMTVSKTELTKLKLKNGEIEGYYNPDSDRLLYEALKTRLIAFDGDAAKAFAEPFYKPKHDGTPGPLVKKVKIVEKTTLNTLVHQGHAIADNDSMVRIDVFYVEGDGYYFVPIYVADTVKPQLPNRAVVANKPYDQWKAMNDDDFIFSLYPCDPVCIHKKNGITMKLKNKQSTLTKSEYIPNKKEVLYYTGADISTGAIHVCNHDRTYMARGIGIKTLLNIEKYQVDVLGNYTRIEKEKRQTFR